MFRRLQPAVTAALALSIGALASGCATFSDSDSVARVDDVALTQDEFETQLADLGAPTDEPLSAEVLRGEISSWIQTQLAGLPVDEEALRGRYEAGAATSGVICIAGIVVADEATADTVQADLEAGTEFADAFAADNLDQQLVATGGALPCASAAPEATEGIPFLEAAFSLGPDQPYGTSPLLDATGAEVAWVVMRFLPFDELTDDDLAAFNSQAADVDVYVSPRYGTFDRASSQVIALG